jgi:hypothetical protein
MRLNRERIEQSMSKFQSARSQHSFPHLSQKPMPRHFLCGNGEGTVGREAVWRRIGGHGFALPSYIVSKSQASLCRSQPYCANRVSSVVAAFEQLDDRSDAKSESYCEDAWNSTTA